MSNFLLNKYKVFMNIVCCIRNGCLRVKINEIKIDHGESLLEPAIAGMHGPHSVFDIGYSTVIRRDPKVCRWLTNEKQRKPDIRLSGQ